MYVCGLRYQGLMIYSQYLYMGHALSFKFQVLLLSSRCLRYVATLLWPWAAANIAGVPCTSVILALAPPCIRTSPLLCFQSLLHCVRQSLQSIVKWTTMHYTDKCNALWIPLSIQQRRIHNWDKFEWATHWRGLKGWNTVWCWIGEHKWETLSFEDHDTRWTQLLLCHTRSSRMSSSSVW